MLYADFFDRVYRIRKDLVVWIFSRRDAEEQGDGWVFNRNRHNRFHNGHRGYKEKADS